MTTLSDLIESTHAAVYTYGVVAAFAKDTQLALNNQATYRQLRDDLISVASANGSRIPAAAAAYTFPIRVTNDVSAKTVAARLENAVCGQWADALAFDEKLRTDSFMAIPTQAALRAFAWSGISYAFPS